MPKYTWFFNLLVSNNLCKTLQGQNKMLKQRKFYTLNGAYKERTDNKINSVKNTSILLAIYPKSFKTPIQKNICTPMFMVVLFTIAKI